MLERLLDSVIIIDHLNGMEAATHFVLGLDPGRTAISVGTSKYLSGGHKHEQQYYAHYQKHERF